MADNAINAERLALKRFSSGFVDPVTEAEYKAWSIEDRLPAIRIAGWIALVAWFTGTTSVFLAYPETKDQFSQYYSVAYGAVIPSIALAMLGSYIRALRPTVMLVSTAILTFTGFVAVWSITMLGGTPGATAVGSMTAIVYAPIMRLMAGWTLAACAPFTAYGIVLVLGMYEGTEQLPLLYWISILFPIITLFTVITVNLMHDRRARCNYRDQRIIDLQKTQLEQTQGQIRRYMPPAVAEQIIQGNEAAITKPKRQRVTVLFADIVGFTDIADRVEPEVMTEVLNDYMSAMADLIEQHGGTLNEFAGDGLMALFGAPDAMTPEDQARNAIQAAQAMLQKMPKLNEQWRKLGLGAELKVRIGINTGMVSVGSYGSQGRMTYTAIGLQTNIAARIESKAEPGETLISDATYQLVSGDIDCEPRGEVECKGVHFPVKVYSPAPVTR